jgi:hypothetical protein
MRSTTLTTLLTLALSTLTLSTGLLAAQPKQVAPTPAPASARAGASTKAVEAAEPGSPASIVRVGGDYTVTTAERKGDREFVVEFKAEHPSGRFDTLRLESDHVHVAVKVGQKLRLSAEILAEHGATADVRQVVLFFPNPAGHVPVWLLSNRAPSTDLRATRYLQMHSPLNDYTVM